MLGGPGGTASESAEREAAAAEEGLTALGLHPQVEDRSEAIGAKGWRFVYYLGVPAVETAAARAYLKSSDPAFDCELVDDPASPPMKADPRPLFAIMIVMAIIAAAYAFVRAR